MDDGRLREVYAAAYPRLVGQLVGVTGDPAEAEDVVMEAFARAAARPREFADFDNPEAWLRTVAVNLAEVPLTLGAPEGTVKARLARGRAALAVLLEPTKEDDVVERG